MCLLLICSAQAIACTPSRAALFRALLLARVLHPDRLLVHLSHTCSLRIDRHLYPVVDIQELVRGATTPRGVNRIIILNPSLKPMHTIEYTTERPLFGHAHQLYLWGDVMINDRMPEGNVLTLTQHGRAITVRHVEANDVPVPPTRQRKQPPQ